MAQLRKRVDDYNDSKACHILACDYRHGHMGLQQDHEKAFELTSRAAAMGDANAHHALWQAYRDGMAVDVDLKKAKRHLDVSAMGGNELARVDLGTWEWNAGRIDRAMKHFMIAARTGNNPALVELQNGLAHGLMTQEEYDTTTRALADYEEETMNDQRREAFRIRWSVDGSHLPRQN